MELDKPEVVVWGKRSEDQVPGEGEEGEAELGPRQYWQLLSQQLEQHTVRNSFKLFLTHTTTTQSSLLTFLLLTAITRGLVRPAVLA